MTARSWMPAMNSELSSTMQRRGELLARIALQRRQMAGVGERLQNPLKWIDRGAAVMRVLRANPLLVAGVVVVLVVRHRNLAGIVRAAWRVWNRYRSFAGVVSRLWL